MRDKNKKSEYHHVELTSHKNIIWRRVVYLIFITIFLIITPIIILYTEGYRYNFKRGKIQKTGILIVSSLPKKANVYINNNLVINDPTPSRIEKLLPTDYDIKLTKEGYHDWQKKLEVMANGTTFAEDIILWKHNLPIQIASQDITNWLGSPDEEKIAISTKDRNIYVLDMDNQELESLYTANNYDNIQIVDWSNTGKKLLIQSGGRFIVLDASRPNLQPIILNQRSYTSMKWDTNNDNLLYGSNNQGIWKIDLFKNNDNLILSRSIEDFIIQNDTIYYFNKNVIYKQNYTEDSNPQIIDGVRCNNCKFINKTFEKLILIDNINQSLFIVDPSSKYKTINKNGKFVSWLNDDTLLFYNDWEIWLLENDKIEPELITRLGSKIDYAIWHTNGRHIIFTSENKIKIIELDNRDLRNIIELFAGENIKYLDLDDKGENLYFNANIANQERIMELNIR